MSIRTTTTVSVLLIGALACLSGCATTVSTTMKVRPGSAEAASLRRVAVFGFRGRNADQVNIAFESMLVNHRFDGTPYFTVVDRSSSAAILDEHARSMRGEIDPSTAAKFGKKVGVQGVYFGDVPRYEVDTRSYQGSEIACIRQGPSGCAEVGTRPVPCREWTATVTVVPRLIEVETQRVVYRAEKTGTMSASACGQGLFGSGPDQELLQRATTSALTQVRADIAPNTTTMSVQLMEKPSNLDAASTAEFKRGLVFAKEARLDRACEIWLQLNSNVRGADNSLLYNVAVCREIQGDYEEALNLFQQVDQRLDRPDSRVSQALKRLNTTIAVQ